MAPRDSSNSASHGGGPLPRFVAYIVESARARQTRSIMRARSSKTTSIALLLY